MFCTDSHMELFQRSWRKNKNMFTLISCQFSLSDLLLQPDRSSKYMCEHRKRHELWYIQVWNLISLVKRSRTQDVIKTGQSFFFGRASSSFTDALCYILLFEIKETNGLLMKAIKEKEKVYFNKKIHSENVDLGSFYVTWKSSNWNVVLNAASPRPFSTTSLPPHHFLMFLVFKMIDNWRIQTVDHLFVSSVFHLSAILTLSISPSPTPTSPCRLTSPDSLLLSG